jgi:predicted Zn finger-like uncharacterized protein
VFTQCSKCETVFKLSAEVLRAASGQVRCGNCGEVFNALARLAEDSSAFASGESSFELESRADSILESTPAPTPTPTPPEPQPHPIQAEEYVPPGMEIAHLQILDEQLSAEMSMEFTLPPGELDRIFIETKPRRTEVLLPIEFDIDPQLSALVASPSPSMPPPDSAPAISPAPALAPALAPAATAAPAPASMVEQAPHPEDATAAQALAAAQVQADAFAEAFDAPDAERFEILSGTGSLEPLSVLNRPRRRPLPALWLSAAVLSALLLLVQVVHHNREWLALHGPFSSTLGALYAKLGVPLPAPANLSAYQLRQWGVSGDPTADGTLRVRASILNTAAQLEPFPLLRVTLANRFGTSIGARDFEASEYLGKPTARLLAPGEQVDATMDILDPGKNAEGFEIDVCLRGADKKISCANDAAPVQTKR